METVLEFGKILLPAAAVLYAMFLTTRMFLNKEYERRLMDIKISNNETILPVRLQAYERVCLFLERISPKNLILRLNTGERSAVEFHQVILNEIRAEYTHNMSQQVYMSEEAWHMVKNGMEGVIMLVNEAAETLDPEAKNLDLARKVFEIVVEKEQLGVELALSFVKHEIQKVF